MSQRTFVRIAAGVFSVIAGLHALRLLMGWHAVIEGWTVPSWISGMALVLFGYLAYIAWKIGR